MCYNRTSCSPTNKKDFMHISTDLSGRVLINSRFGVSYSNFSFLTPTFWKVSKEKYGKTPTFSGRQHFTPTFKILVRTLSGITRFFTLTLHQNSTTEINIIQTLAYLIQCSLKTPKRVGGKQCRPRSDAAKIRVI